MGCVKMNHITRCRKPSSSKVIADVHTQTHYDTHRSLYLDHYTVVDNNFRMKPNCRNACAFTYIVMVRRSNIHVTWPWWRSLNRIHTTDFDNGGNTTTTLYGCRQGQPKVTGNSIAAIRSYLLLPNPTGDDVTPYRGGHSGVEGHVIRTSTRRQIGIRVKLS